MTPIEELQQLRQRFRENFDTIENCRQANVAIWERIRQLESVIKQEPLDLYEHTLTLDNGGLCFVCQHRAKRVCQICLLSNSPCGYCDKHWTEHDKSFGAQHLAVFRIIKQEQKSTERTYTREPQTIEAMDTKIAELKKRLGL